MPASGSSRSPGGLRRLRANGIELHYIERGSGDALVLVHGGSGDYRSWQHQLEPFSRRFRVIAYSRRHSYPNRNRIVATGHSVDAEARDLAALIDVRRLEPVHLVGHSYGALTALVAALARPDTVRSLVLAEPPLHGWVKYLPDGEALLEGMRATVWAPTRQAFEQGEVRNALRLFTDGICGRGYFDRLPARERAARLRNARAVRALLHSSGAFPVLSRQKVHALTVPTLLVEGENTIPIHRAVDDELLRRIPGAKRVVIPAAGHGTPRDNARAFNEAVMNFLSRIPSSSRSRM